MSEMAVGALSAAPPAAAADAPVRVLHIINGEHYAGAERVQDLLAASLPARGFEAVFACLKEGTFQSRLMASNRRAGSFIMRSRLDALRVARAVADYARRNQCRLIHSHTARGALVAGLVARMTGLPLVHHVHSPTSRDSTHRLLNRINAGVERVALSRASALVPVSGSLAQHLRQGGYPARKIHVVPNGVRCWPAVAARRLEAEGEGPLVVGVVGLFRPRKGLEVLIEALGAVVAQGHDLELRAVGTFEDATYREELLALVRRLGLETRVDWRGFRRDVQAELAAMDVLALPSLFGEGMPMVVLEAMAAGLPVVATRVEGVPEVVRHEEEGLLVEPGDPAALAQALAQCVRRPGRLRAMGESGRRRQAARFSDAAMAAALAKVYRRVLQQRG